MEDGASVHTASSTMDYLRTMVSVIEDWPASSPDLNTIETLWAILKRRVQELRPGDKRELVQILTEAWESLGIRTINNLIGSMQRRIQLLIENAGNRLRYSVKILIVDDQISKNDGSPRNFLSPFESVSAWGRVYRLCVHCIHQRIQELWNFL
jgi:hypothetical protein